jgi:hypothetical protein
MPTEVTSERLFLTDKPRQAYRAQGMPMGKSALDTPNTPQSPRAVVHILEGRTIITTLDLHSGPPVRPQHLFRKLTFAAVVLLLVAFTSNLALDRDEREGDGDGRNAYAIGLWGDLPYSTTQATVGVPNLIADMNRQKPRLHSTRRRSEERLQRVHRCGVHPGGWLFWNSPCASHLHSWRQRLGGWRRKHRCSGRVT